MTPRPLISTHSVSRRNHESGGLWPKTTTRKLAGRLWNKSRSPIWTDVLGESIQQAPPPADPRIATGSESKSQDGKSGQQPIFVGTQFPLCDAHCQKKQGASCFSHSHRCSKRNPQPFETLISASARFVCFLGVRFWFLVLDFLVLGPWFLGGFRIRTVVPACLEPAEAPPIQTAREGKTPDNLTGRFHPPTHKAVDTPLESCPRRSLAFLFRRIRIVETSRRDPAKACPSDN